MSDLHETAHSYLDEVLAGVKTQTKNVMPDEYESLLNFGITISKFSRYILNHIEKGTKPIITAQELEDIQGIVEHLAAVSTKFLEHTGR